MGKNKKKDYRFLGYRGEFGYSLFDGPDSQHNKNIDKANKVIEEYNSKINTFLTETENNKFAKKIEERINKIFSKKY